ncbi:hypothetical protein [Priestia koreensis]
MMTLSRLLVVALFSSATLSVVCYQSVEIIHAIMDMFFTHKDL